MVKRAWVLGVLFLGLLLSGCGQIPVGSDTGVSIPDVNMQNFYDSSTASEESMPLAPVSSVASVSAAAKISVSTPASAAVSEPISGSPSSKTMSYQRELTEKKLQLIVLREEYESARKQKELEITNDQKVMDAMQKNGQTQFWSATVAYHEKLVKELEDLIRDYESMIQAVEIRIAELEALIQYNVPQQ